MIVELCLSSEIIKIFVFDYLVPKIEIGNKILLLSIRRLKEVLSSPPPNLCSIKRLVRDDFLMYLEYISWWIFPVHAQAAIKKLPIKFIVAAIWLRIILGKRKPSQRRVYWKLYEDVFEGKRLNIPPLRVLKKVQTYILWVCE